MGGRRPHSTSVSAFCSTQLNSYLQWGGCVLLCLHLSTFCLNPEPIQMLFTWGSSSASVSMFCSNTKKFNLIPIYGSRRCYSVSTFCSNPNQTHIPIYNGVGIGPALSLSPSLPLVQITTHFNSYLWGKGVLLSSHIHLLMKSQLNSYIQRVGS